MARAVAASAGGIAVAVVGATGLVGEALLAALSEREFPVSELFALGRDHVDDETVLFADRPKQLRPLADFDFSRCKLAFFCTPPEVSAAHAPRAVASGCTVIDVSRVFRLEKDVPLVAAEANGDSLAGTRSRLISSPSAEAVQLAAVLAPIRIAAGLRRVDVTTALAVSDRGRPGIAELAGQTAKLLNVQSIDSHTFPAQIAFNLMACTDGPDVAAELRKILCDNTLVVDSWSHYTSVFYGHSQVIRLETEQAVSLDALRKCLRKTPGLKVMASNACLTPVDDGVGGDAVMIGQIRAIAGVDNGFLLWTLSDNVRKGAAVNSVQIAETLLKAHL